METTIETRNKAKMSMPGVMLRLEGVAVLAGSVALYAWLGYSWVWFAALFFLPDSALFVYLVDQRSGRIAYNFLHTITIPLLLALAGLLTGGTVLTQVGLIWLAHIGMDRAIGYGFKYAGEFKITHLQKV